MSYQYIWLIMNVQGEKRKQNGKKESLLEGIAFK